MVYYSKNENDTMLLGEKLGEAAKFGDIFCLIGDLAAGKTVFSKGFARGLGIDRQITSPTFTFLNEYEGRLPFYHFDAYRLENAGDAMCFDFEEYFDSGVCVIEWAGNIADAIPERASYVIFEKIKDNDKERKITVRPAQVKKKPEGKQTDDFSY